MHNPNRIDVLLLDGASDHYLVPVSMLARTVDVDGETYERTDEMRKVTEKDALTSTHRVYRLAHPQPRLMDMSDLEAS